MIEYEVCGRNILLNKNDTDPRAADAVYRYGVDRSMKEIKIEYSIYSTWFQNPSENCTIEYYKIQQAKNKLDEEEGNIDIYDPNQFKNPPSEYF